MKPTYEQLEQQLLEQAVQLTNAESKCRELAAENAVMNVFIEEECFVYSSDTPEPIDANDCKPETPSTDAFLAEVRSSAIPADVMAAIQKVARIRLDLNDFDGDKRGIIYCLSEAEESLIEVVNKFASQLRKGVQS